MSDFTEYAEKREYYIDVLITKRRARALHLADGIGTPEARREAKILRTGATKDERALRRIDEYIGFVPAAAGGAEMAAADA